LPVFVLSAAPNSIRIQKHSPEILVQAPAVPYPHLPVSLTDAARIKDGDRFDWQPHAVFVTPPGLWHFPYIVSGLPAHIMPKLAAGLHTSLWTRDNGLKQPSVPGGWDVVVNAGLGSSAGGLPPALVGGRPLRSITFYGFFPTFCSFLKPSLPIL